MASRSTALVAHQPSTLVLPSPAAADVVPVIIRDAGEKASRRWLEFFTAQLRNANTRQAYARAARRFSDWCTELGLSLADLDPIVASTYVEQLAQELSPSSVKQHLAALRRLGDWLVIGQIIEHNPFSPVRGPRIPTSTGKTPVLAADDVRRLLDSIDTTTVVRARDKAIIAVMVYSFARVSAVIGLRLRDYENHGRKAFLALKEKGGKLNRVPVHHAAAQIIDHYLELAQLEDRQGPLFLAAVGRTETLANHAPTRRSMLAMVKRRAKAIGIPPDAITNHTFRASGITNYMRNGGSLEVAAQIAGHVSTDTTQLYNRTRDEIGQDEIERIRF